MHIDSPRTAVLIATATVIHNLGHGMRTYCSTYVNSALHFHGVAKSSTTFDWGDGGNVTSAGWQVTLCDPIWHASSRSGVAGLQYLANCDTPFAYLLYLLKSLIYSLVG